MRVVAVSNVATVPPDHPLSGLVWKSTSVFSHPWRGPLQLVIVHYAIILWREVNKQLCLRGVVSGGAAFAGLGNATALIELSTLCSRGVVLARDYNSQWDDIGLVEWG